MEPGEGVLILGFHGERRKVSLGFMSVMGGEGGPLSWALSESICYIRLFFFDMKPLYLII